jgi:hypothetical protein
LIPRSNRREKSLGTAVAVKIHVMAHNRGDTRRQGHTVHGRRLVGVAMLLLGVAQLLPAGLLYSGDGDTLFAVAILLTGVALLLLGVAVLLYGVAGLFDGHALVGLAVLLGSVAMLLNGVAVLRDVDTLLGVALLLFSVAMLLNGVAVLLVLLDGVAGLRDRRGRVLVSVTGLLFGVAMLLFGVALLRDGDTLVGVAVLLVLLFGVAMLLFGVAKLRNQHQG